MVKCASKLLSPHLLLALLLLAAPARTSSAGTAGTRLQGFNFHSDVSDVVALSGTFCSIFNAFVQGNPAKALDLYYSPKGYAELVASTHNRGKPLYQILFSGISWQSPADINHAFNASVQAGDRVGLLINALTHSRGKIMIDYLDTAISAKSKSSVLKALDGAWAMLVSDSSAACPNTEPSSMNDVFALEGEMNAFQYHRTPLNTYLMAKLFGDAQAVAHNSSAVKALALQVLQVYSEFALLYLRKNSFSEDLGRGCGRPRVVAASTSRSAAIWPTAMALLKGLGGGTAQLQALGTLLPTAPGFLNVTAAIAAVISSTDIHMEDLGAPVYSSIKASWAQVYGTNPLFDMSNCTYVPPMQ